MSLSIITVTHNSKKDLFKYVESFLAYKNKIDIEFIFVENSGDESISDATIKLKKTNHKVTHLFSENKGFGAGCNIGAKHATNNILLFANPDIEFRSNFDELLMLKDVKFFGGGRIAGPNGIDSSVDLYPEHKNIFTEIFNPQRHKFIKDILPSRFFFPTGAFFFSNKELFFNVGGFDEEFFLYHEESELSHRLRNETEEPIIFDKIKAHHKGFGSHSSNNKALLDETESFIKYCQKRNKLKLLKERLDTFYVLSLFSNNAKKRFRILKQRAFK